MKDLSPDYRKEGKYTLIEIELESLLQLFNTFDPSPFYQKDIDNDAEEYIVDAVREIDISDPVKLIIYLPPEEIAHEDVADITNNIHNYFNYRTKAAQRELRLVFKNGRLSLAIGLSFLALCVATGYTIQPLFGNFEVLSNIAREGLLISGWVAMWRPIQIFLYDWWPVSKKIRVMHKISRVEVEIRPNENAEYDD